MSLRDANAFPDGGSLGAYREGAALLQTRRENGGQMRFPDHASPTTRPISDTNAVAHRSNSANSSGPRRQPLLGQFPPHQPVLLP